MNTPTKDLLPLVARLKSCPAHDVTISRELVLKCWEELKREDITPHINPTAPVMAALLMSDDRFKSLLNEAENSLLAELIGVALTRYETKTNPPNKLGKLIAGSIKKEQI